MAYATLDQFKARLSDALYAQLTDLSGGTTPSDTVGQAVLDGAHGTMNAYLAKRYSVPIVPGGDTTVAQFLLKHVLQIAEYDAWQGHAMRRNMHERVQKGYDETMRLLRDIAKGLAELPGETAIPGATASGPSAEAFGDDRVFTRDSMKGF